MKRFKVLGNIKASGKLLKPGDVVAMDTFPKQDKKQLLKDKFIEVVVVKSPAVPKKKSYVVLVEEKVKTKDEKILAKDDTFSDDMEMKHSIAQMEQWHWIAEKV